MKKQIWILSLAIAAIAAGLSSCSKTKTADARDLLATVPSDATLVCVANVESLLENAGCKVNGDKITPSKELTAAVNSIENASAREIVSMITNGESGIDASLLALFRVGYYTYLTGIAADPAKFKGMFEKDGAKFGDSNGVEVCKNVALIGNNFWINLGSLDIDSREAKHFSNLQESQSFLSNPAGEDLAEVSHDIEAWGSVDGIANSVGMDFQDRAYLKMLTQTLFDDLQTGRVDADFKKGEAELELSFYNSKNKKAKFQLPISKVDMKAIESVSSGASVLAAVAVPNKLIQQIRKEASGSKFSFMGSLLQSLSCIDGTIAGGFQSKDSFRAVICTNGDNVPTLTKFVKEMLPQSEVKIDGKQVMVTEGAAPSAKNEDLKDYFKGCMAGVVFSEGMVPSSKADGFKTLACLVEPDDNSVNFELKVATKDKDENALITILRFATK